MNIERLLKLADHLETVSPDKFDMNFWWLEDTGRAVVAGEALTPCGSAGCAMGHATTIPEFQELGLHLSMGPWHGQLRPCYENAAGMWAAVKFFDINLTLARGLFRCDSYEREPTAKEVAARIRFFVAHYQPTEDA